MEDKNINLEDKFKELRKELEDASKNLTKVNGETKERRDFLLATIIVICVMGIVLAPIIEYRAGAPLETTAAAMTYLKEFAMMIITGYFAIEQATKRG